MDLPRDTLSRSVGRVRCTPLYFESSLMRNALNLFRISDTQSYVFALGKIQCKWSENDAQSILSGLCSQF
jgi:hypothetical protein